MRVPIAAPELPDDPSAPRPPPARSPGTGTRVWLVRHAEVHEDWQNHAYGGLDVPLSDAGREQTREMGARFAGLPVVSVTASHLVRALAMGQAIAESTRAPLTIDPRLREVSRGAWQGLPTEEFRARWAADKASFLADPWRWRGHGGESDADLFARGWPVVLERIEAARGGHVVLASHFNMVRTLVTGAMGWSGRESFAFRIETARATLLIDAPGGFVVAARNVDDPRPFAAT